ncbi:MAG: DUF924 family protein, partial [Enterococcus sp.]
MEEEAVLKFWFKEVTPKQWFVKDEIFDQEIRERFKKLHQQVSQGEMRHWRKTASSSLAEIIVLDQFSRNLFREDARAFAQDSMALVLAQVAIDKNFHLALPIEQRAFLYMPFMHSESTVIHHDALQYFAEAGLEENLKFEKRH